MVALCFLKELGDGQWQRLEPKGAPGGDPDTSAPTSAALAQGNPRPSWHWYLHLFDGIPSLPVLTLHLTELVLSSPVH